MKKTFFDEDIVIDESLFSNFKIQDIVSWSHLALWCAVNGIEINYAFFKGILCGTSVFQKLHEIVLDALQTTDFLDNFLTNVEVIEIIMKLYDDVTESRTFKAREFWLELAYQQHYDSTYFSYFNTGISYDNKQKYMLLNAIFCRKPLLLVKFYDKHKLAVHQHDIKFEKWLLRKCQRLSSKSKLFQKLSEAMHAEITKLDNLTMYLH